jgi:hypothetical protein
MESKMQPLNRKQQSAPTTTTTSVQQQTNKTIIQTNKTDHGQIVCLNNNS